MKAFVIGIALLGLSGCASFKHTFASDDADKVYIGTKRNWKSITQDGCGGADGKCDGVNPIFDLPFSAVMDTLLLPYTLTRRGGEEDGREPAPGPLALSANQ